MLLLIGIAANKLWNHDLVVSALVGANAFVVVGWLWYRKIRSRGGLFITAFVSWLVVGLVAMTLGDHWTTGLVLLAVFVGVLFQALESGFAWLDVQKLNRTSPTHG